MGNDNNQPGGHKRAPVKSAPKPVNPFGRKVVDREVAYLSDVPGLTTIVEALVASGRAIMLSRTRDGGAYVVQILDGDERFKSYASTQPELDAIFQELQDAYGANAPE